nr:TIGR02186 family protein [Iodidimonas nitroreducens]
MVFADGVVIAEDVIDIAVGKTGFERAVYQVARNDPAIYGLSAVLIALLAGWAAGFLSRR